jgi:hypothetical protein
MAYLQYQFGAQLDTAGRALSDTSYSAQLLGSEKLWMLLEGTHVLTLMLFAGTILFVDLRLLGLAFRSVPISRISRALLPYTVAGLVIIFVTGILVFFAKPLEYYHNFAFRVKLVLLLVAVANIAWFHFKVQTGEGEWDRAERPPLRVRAAGAVSILVWVAVIATGRCMAYEWFTCDAASPFVAAAAQCAEKNATLAAIQPEIAP